MIQFHYKRQAHVHRETRGWTVRRAEIKNYCIIGCLGAPPVVTTEISRQSFYFLTCLSLRPSLSMCVAFSIPYYMTTFDHSKKFCLCVFSQVWCTSLWLLKIFPLHCGFNIHLAIFLSKAYCFSALSRFCIQQKGDKCLWQFLRELVGSFEQRHTILEV